MVWHLMTVHNYKEVATQSTVKEWVNAVGSISAHCMNQTPWRSLNMLQSAALRNLLLLGGYFVNRIQLWQQFVRKVEIFI